MSNINTIPASDLKNNYAEVTRTVRESSQPVILTENGSEDMVIMSYQAYQNFLLDMEIYLNVKEAEEMEENDGKMYTIEDFLQAAHSAIKGEDNV